MFSFAKPLCFLYYTTPLLCLHVAWGEAVIEVDSSLWLVELASLSLLGLLGSGIYLLDLLWVGSNQAGFRRAGHYLDMDVVLPGKEESLTDRELAETFGLFAGQLENFAEYINGGRGLF